MLFKLLLAPYLIIDGRLSVLVDILPVGCRSLYSLIGQVPRILKAETEIMLAKLGTHIIVLRASNALAHRSLILALLGAELVVAAHPDILFSLILIVVVASLSQLVQARRITFRVCEEHLIRGLEVILTLPVLLLAICQINRAV